MMSKTKYSKEQLKAIKTKGTNLLVSASAGSGKTTVLIERIIHKIKTENWNIDELLVVTFTEAAANELKLRIRKKITSELLNEPTNIHLRKQLPKVGSANISTFHSFCNQVLKKFFYLINFEAMYNIADDIEVDMIAIEVLEELFVDCFDNNDEKFLLVINRFSDKIHDEKLKKIIFDLYKKLRTFPYYHDFMEEFLKNYQIDNSLSSWKFYSLFINTISKQVNEAKSYFLEAYNLALQYEHPYTTQYQEDVKICEQILSLEEYDSIYSYLQKISFVRFKSKCDTIDDNNKEIIRSYRDKGKEIIDKIKMNFFQYKEKSQVKFLKENYRVLKALFYVVDLFGEKFSKSKRDKNIVDFSDLEELTLEILTYNNGDNEAVTYYKRLFKEILIDEFQDTNSFQEAIIKEIASGNNLFMVGDVKQSIYRFRSAEPEIFQYYYKKYKNNQNGKLINLNANYRSRKEVIDYINFLFYQLMDEEYFEIDYDSDASLVFGQKNYPHMRNEQFIHFHMIDKKHIKRKYSDYDKSEFEAHLLAQNIRDLIDRKQSIYDNKLKDLRPVKYNDIVIMSRTKKEQETYHEVFKSYNIPFLADDLTGYFNSIEVLTVTSILKVIDNPLQDIPLVAVLRSPIYNINERELVELKVSSSKDNYYEKLEDYINTGKDPELRDKLIYFYKMLDYWRNKVKYTSITEILYSIYHETNYYDFVLGQSGGKQRQANLDLLFNRAKQYEHIYSNSLFKFIQLINFFMENDKDLPQARTLSDNEDLVRFMTIHKSKGLEFPICFVTNLGKDYNISDEKSDILFDKELGIAFSYLDINYRVKYQTIYQNLLKDKLRKLMLAEELRLLYVALTRAKEQVFLIGTVKDFENTISKINYLVGTKELLLPIEHRYAINYLSLVLNASLRHPNFKSVYNVNENKSFLEKLNIPECDFKLITDLELLTNNDNKKEDLTLDFSKYTKEFSERLNYKYPHIEKTIYFAKQTIADIKRAQSQSEYQYNHERIMLKEPKFVNVNKEEAMQRGTSIHQFMQHIDYYQNYSIDDIRKLKLNLLEKEIMNDEQLSFINEEKIYVLLSQDLIRDIKEANRINKEMPFTTLVPSNKVYKKSNSDTDILVQGVVDLFVEFENKCILIDFKSDRISHTKEEVEKIKHTYKVQLNIYKEAMEKIYANYKIEAYLYLFAIDKFIKM